MAEVPGQFAGRNEDVGRDRGMRLPPRRVSFVGRTADLPEVAARLGRYPVVTLTGVGGVGKTALAIEAAWAEVSAGRAERACYVDLVPCRTGEQVVAALVEGVGIRGAGAAAGIDGVAEAVSDCRSLLVLDNCEHVLEPARGACDKLRNWAAVVPALLDRAHQEAIGGVLDRETAELVRDLRGRPDVARLLTEPDLSPGSAPIVDLHFDMAGTNLRFFSVVSTIGAPIDVTAQELRVEAFFPADGQTGDRWTSLEVSERASLA